MKRIANSALVLAIGFVLGALVVGIPQNAEGDGEPVASRNGDINGDDRINLTDAVYLLQWLFQSGSPPVAIECSPEPQESIRTLPATGVVECFTAPKALCPESHCNGQDGGTQTGCPMEGRFNDNGDGTITDRCTGLMWQKGFAPRRYIWCEAIDYCQNLELAGHKDWRLPNINELTSLYYFGDLNLIRMIHPIFDNPDGSLWWYMSSTPAALNVEGYVAAVYVCPYQTGSVLGGMVDMPQYVRAVRNF